MRTPLADKRRVVLLCVVPCWEGMLRADFSNGRSSFFACEDLDWELLLNLIEGENLQ